ncbi:helix-turn-helix domain-containing protein [Halostreptopolyspora alba]|uniref:XRE family transcriptional regulator n=1 Tax=Halostreptopolyspora alba TaxID=2487137 RepID=A0A3N0ECK5_9ACTN|nr:XRE family transcriptional regulator [Nocardiopsaceae bacterium YIM 96095]
MTDHRPTPRWLWVHPHARSALASGDVGTIVACYRRLTGLSQAALGQQLGYDPSYISLLERGQRRITDHGSLSHLSRALAIPPHALGITTEDDADFRAALQFGDSTVRLAETARQAGRATEAAEELWPLTARLEARLAEGRVDAPTIALLARARVTLGTSLGHVLTEEQLATAARWTGKALTLARHLDDSELLHHVLTMHGNELRKISRTGAAIARLHHALALSTSPVQRGFTLPLLARAAGEHGDADLFDRTIADAEHTLAETGNNGILLTPYSLREIRLRGLLNTGRAHQAAQLAHRPIDTTTAPAPQWGAIERITTANAFMALGDHQSASDALTRALDIAHRHRLPHQIQRILRTTTAPHQSDLHHQAGAALQDLRQLTVPGRGL